MTKSNKLTAAELKDLKSVGYVEGQPNTIPENIDPSLKAKILEQWREDNDVQNAQDLPNAIEVGNQMSRDRANADEGNKPTGAHRQGSV